LGRISLPLLNRSGNFLFWNSVWDDKHNYSKNLKEDIFIKMCIPLIFRTRFSKKFISFLKKYHLKESEIIQNDILNFTTVDYKNLCSFYSRKNKKIDIYFSKVWILKYQGWVIVYFFYYSSLFNKALTFTKLHGYFEFQYNSIFYNYYTNFIKLGFDFNSFKKSNKKGFIF